MDPGRLLEGDSEEYEERDQKKEQEDEWKDDQE